MNKLILGAALIATSAPVMAGDVGVSITLNQPGLFGQINIGEVAQQPPQLIYAQPVVIQRDASYAGEPIYLHVPPGHEKHWGKHCAQYNACGRPVYFVRDDWYNREYVPRHQEHGDHRDDDGHRHEGDHRDDDGHRHGGDHRDDDGHRNGKDHEHDHDRGHDHDD